MVGYATKHGATSEIAERIGQGHSRAGLSADVVAVESVTDLAPYQAFVLGSAVYVGQWQKEAASFLEQFEEHLAQRPVWLFSSGPTGKGDPAQLMKGWRFPQALQATADRILPRDIALFHGALEPKRLSLAEKLVIKGVKAPLGTLETGTRSLPGLRPYADSLKKQPE
jgi:menaquinone-dependent protoporphyrinogen oxidase